LNAVGNLEDFSCSCVRVPFKTFVCGDILPPFTTFEGAKCT